MLVRASRSEFGIMKSVRQDDDDGDSIVTTSPPPPPPPTPSNPPAPSRTQTAHALVAALMAFIAVSGACTLALSWRRGWGWRPAALDAAEVALRWGYADYRGLLAPEGSRLHETLGAGPQVFGALVVVSLSVSILFSLYVLHTSVMFGRGWYEAASAAGGLRAALPGFAVGVSEREREREREFVLLICWRRQQRESERARERTGEGERESARER